MAIALKEKLGCKDFVVCYSFTLTLALEPNVKPTQIFDRESDVGGTWRVRQSVSRSAVMSALTSSPL